MSWRTPRYDSPLPILYQRRSTDALQIHILGGYKNVQIARASVCNLILGKQPGKVYNNLRAVSARMKERF